MPTNSPSKTSRVAWESSPRHHSGEAYERHRPEETLLWKTIQEHWTTFLRDLEAGADAPVLPRFVTAELEAFLRCGILAHGFVLVKCRDCGWCRPVAYSCRRRGFCASCLGRRMCDFAAALADRVMPRVPVRQWVLTVPRELRAKLAYDPALTTVVLHDLIAAVSSWLRGRARRLGIRGVVKTGAVTVIQRFNSALDVSPHFHVLFLDGVYSFPTGAAPVFHPTPGPTDEDVARVVAAVFRRVEQKLVDHEPATRQRRFVEDAPLLVAMAEASARGVVATGPRRGCRIVRVKGPTADVDAFVLGRLCAEVEGYNLQAATRIGAKDREGLERMGRYLARPPIGADRLSRLEDGRLELRLKRPWRDGTVALRFTPHELIERLVAQVPRPRAHLARYHGVLAPAFAARAQIVPGEGSDGPGPPASGTDVEPSKVRKRPGRHPWASLIWRVFLTDAFECRRCSGRMELIAAVTSPAGIERILTHMGLSRAPSSFHPPRPPPQADLPFAVAGFEPDPPALDDFDP